MVVIHDERVSFECRTVVFFTIIIEILFSAQRVRAVTPGNGRNVLRCDRKLSRRSGGGSDRRVHDVRLNVGIRNDAELGHVVTDENQLV